MVICLEWGADLHMAQLMPLPLTVSRFTKIQNGLPFWYRLTWVVPEKGPLNGCVCVLQVIPADNWGPRMHRHWAPRQVVTAKQQDDRRTAGKGSTFPPSVVSPHSGPQQQLHSFTQTATSRDVMEPAKICFDWIHILCFKSVGYGRKFATQLQLVPLNSYLSMSVLY